jgi:hypothetical protein
VGAEDHEVGVKVARGVAQRPGGLADRLYDIGADVAPRELVLSLLEQPLASESARGSGMPFRRFRRRLTGDRRVECRIEDRDVRHVGNGRRASARAASAARCAAARASRAPRARPPLLQDLLADLLCDLLVAPR